MYGLQFLCMFMPGTNSFCGDEVDFKALIGLPFEFKMYVGDLVALGTGLMSVQYNFLNFYIGFRAAKDKTYAVQCMLPFFYICGILWLSCIYSQFWEQYTLWFIFGVGMLITSITGHFNLVSCSKSKFNPFFLDPLVFIVILYCDYNRVFAAKYVAAMYMMLVIERSVAYVSFMRSMIHQLTSHLGINFIVVDKSKLKK